MAGGVIVGVPKILFVAGVGGGTGEAALPKENVGGAKAVDTGTFVGFGVNSNGGEVAGAVAARATGAVGVAEVELADEVLTGGAVAGRGPTPKLKEEVGTKVFCSGGGDFRPSVGGVTEGGVGKEPAPFMAVEDNVGTLALNDEPSSASVDKVSPFSSPPSSSSTTAFANGERRVGRVLGRPSPIPNGEEPEEDVDGRGAT